MRLSIFPAALAAALFCAAPLSAQGNVLEFGGDRRMTEQDAYRSGVGRQVNDALELWRAAWNADDADLAALRYARDARVALPGAGEVEGRAAIRDALAGFLRGHGAVNLRVLRFYTSGNLAYRLDHVVLQGDGGAVETWTAMTVLRREGPREWAIEAQLFTPAAAAPQGAANAGGSDGSGSPES
ncbi:MAG TPA: nuclear transport factor 2 family protein [Longimicrobium sp.]|nr:nuclear transport factor 2 family protein [Longimicrobium sp.]